MVDQHDMSTVIGDYCTILYIGSRDGYVTEEMKKLNNRFSMIPIYVNSERKLGHVIRTEYRNINYVLYGCIVRNSQGDPFNFEFFEMCLRKVRGNYEKDKHYYVAIDAFRERTDEMIMAKIINLMRNTLHDMEIHICWSDPSP